MLCLLQQFPTLALAEPLGIRLTVLCPSPGSRDQTEPPSSPGYSPTGEKETEAGRRRKSSQMGEENSESPSPLGLIPSWAAGRMGWRGAGLQARRDAWPFSSWAMDALVHGSLQPAQVNGVARNSGLLGHEGGRGKEASTKRDNRLHSFLSGTKLSNL